MGVSTPCYSKTMVLTLTAHGTCTPRAYNKASTELLQRKLVWEESVNWFDTKCTAVILNSPLDLLIILQWWAVIGIITTMPWWWASIRSTN